MRSGRVLATTAVLATLLVGGCGSSVAGEAGAASGGDAASASSSAPATASQADAVAWTNQVCGVILDKLGPVMKAPNFSTAGGLASIKQQFASYLGKAERAFGDTITGLQNVGPAPTETGDKGISAVVDGIRTIKQKMHAANAELAKADPSDPAAFENTLQQVTKKLQGIDNMPDPTAGLDNDPVLEQASKKAPKCKQVDKLGQ